MEGNGSTPWRKPSTGWKAVEALHKGNQDAGLKAEGAHNEETKTQDGKQWWHLMKEAKTQDGRRETHPKDNIPNGRQREHPKKPRYRMEGSGGTP